jgi:sugar lactone lactonase YvrE
VAAFDNTYKKTLMKQHQATLFANDFLFLEAPRWHQNQLWVSDVFDSKLYVIQTDGSRRVVCEVPHRPSGIGFLPDGSAVVVSSRDQKLMKLVDGALVVHADLAPFATGYVNDLVVDERGRIYVGNFGYDFYGNEPKALSDLHLVDTDGAVRVAASGVEFPNGMVLTNGGRTLVVAETWACRLTAFDRNADGELSNQRLYADLGTREPDGICVDAEGGIWVACFNTGEFLRILDGGAATDRIAFAPHAISCGLGGKDGRTLFCSAYTGSVADMDAGKRLAAIYTVEVDIPGTGTAGT